MKHVTIRASWFVGHVTVMGMIVYISGSILYYNCVLEVCYQHDRCMYILLHTNFYFTCLFFAYYALICMCASAWAAELP